MRVWIVVLSLLGITFAGCMADGDAPELEEVDDGSGDVQDGSPDGARPPEAETGPNEQVGNETDEDGPPLGGRRTEETWNGPYACLAPPGVECSVQEHAFDVPAVYGAITATVTIDHPGVVCCNSLGVALVDPEGQVAGASIPYGATAGGPQATVTVDDPEMLERLGAWSLRISTGEVAATFVTYAAEVSFEPHPDRAAPVPPDRIALDATHYLGADFPVEWARVARLMPEGFEPMGFPYFYLLDGHRGLPEGTFVSVIVVGLEYAAARVDGTNLSAGRLALAIALVDPPREHEHRPQSYLWVGAVASDPRLADALSAWGVPASVGSIEIVLAAEGPYQTGRLDVEGGPLDVTLETRGENQRPVLGSPDRDQEMAHFTAPGKVLAESLIWSLGRHKAFPGAVTMEGKVGAIGHVASPGVGGILWFGSADAPSDETGTWSYERIVA